MVFQINYHSSSLLQQWAENHSVLLQYGETSLCCGSQSAERYPTGSTFTCSKTSLPLSLSLSEIEMFFFPSYFCLPLIPIQVVKVQENTQFIIEIAKTNTFTPIDILEFSVHLTCMSVELIASSPVLTSYE